MSKSTKDEKLVEPESTQFPSDENSIPKPDADQPAEEIKDFIKGISAICIQLYRKYKKQADKGDNKDTTNERL